MIERRLFLKKLTGFAVAVCAIDALTETAWADAGDASANSAVIDPPTSILRAPGTYQISGSVRLHEPLVEISGITNAQQISWSAGSITSAVASFTSFERFEQPWQMPEIRVRGGELEALTVVPVDFG